MQDLPTIFIPAINERTGELTDPMIFMEKKFGVKAAELKDAFEEMSPPPVIFLDFSRQATPFEVTRHIAAVSWGKKRKGTLDTSLSLNFCLLPLSFSVLLLLVQIRYFETCAALIICLRDGTAMTDYKEQTRATFFWVPPMTRDEAGKLLDNRGYKLTNNQRDQLFTHYGTLAGPLREVAKKVFKMPAEQQEAAIQAEIHSARHTATQKLNDLLELGQPGSIFWANVVLRLLDTVDPNTAPLGGRVRLDLPGRERNAAIEQLKMNRALH
jgi:hypothetical protein